MDWRQWADEEMARTHPKRYAAPRLPEPPELQPPAEDRRQLPRNVHFGRFPDQDVIWVDGWIRSLRWLVAYRGLDVDDVRCSLGTTRRGEDVRPQRRPVGR